MNWDHEPPMQLVTICSVEPVFLAFHDVALPTAKPAWIKAETAFSPMFTGCLWRGMKVAQKVAQERSTGLPGGRSPGPRRAVVAQLAPLSLILRSERPTAIAFPAAEAVDARAAAFASVRFRVL